MQLLHQGIAVGGTEAAGTGFEKGKGLFEGTNTARGFDRQ